MIRFTEDDVRGMAVDVSTLGDNELLSPTANRSFMLVSFLLSADGAVELTWKGAHNSGPFPMAAGQNGAREFLAGLVHTNEGQGLTLNLSAAERVTGSIRYVQFIHGPGGIVNPERRSF